MTADGGLPPAEAAIERVRALHREEHGCCAHCTRADAVVYPCPTIEAIGDLTVERQAFPIVTHRYEGFGFEAPCTARGYGTACGESEYDHTEKA